ncbi:hypothetical protein Dimus_012320 [Dionaea muscipula]
MFLFFKIYVHDLSRLYLCVSSVVECRFIQQKLGGPSLDEFEKLQSEMSNLQMKYDELLAAHQDTCRQLVEIKGSYAMATSEEIVQGKPQMKNREADDDGRATDYQQKCILPRVFLL